MSDTILTFDIGTTGNKCTLFDTRGRALASATIPYETEYPMAGWAQQDPEAYWDSVVTGMSRLSQEYPQHTGRVSCIGLSGHMNGMLPISAAGEPVFPEIIHSDSRSDSYCSSIRERINDDEFFRITGNRIDSHLSLPKMLWFKDSYPELYKKTAWIIQSKDFIAGRLTGCWGSTDYSDASLTCVLDLKERDWSDRILKETGLNGKKMPRLLSSHEMVGTLNREAASLLGLKEGIPVFAGGGDASCSARGAGIADCSTAQNYIGSSSWISVLSPQPLLDRGRRIQNFYDLDGKHINVCGTVQCAGIALDWMMNEISGGSCDYRAVEAEAAQSPPGAEGLYFIPYFMGERTPHWNSNLKGSFLGLSLNHKNRDMIRAVFEGIAFALKDVVSVFEENGIEIAELSLTGGGALSPFWNGMMSSIYGKPVKIPHAPKQATSLGAALAAGVGCGIFGSYEAAAEVVQFERSASPVEADKEKYRNIYAGYRKLYPAYKALSDVLSESRIS
ncbi:MAG: FGGY family carbohydrate kinase [Spirochaetales bacterium]|nr:FGGY family carbohydrate kinase [Spirochaetales bacterium]